MAVYQNHFLWEPFKRLSKSLAATKKSFFIACFFTLSNLRYSMYFSKKLRNFAEYLEILFYATLRLRTTQNEATLDGFRRLLTIFSDLTYYNRKRPQKVLHLLKSLVFTSLSGALIISYKIIGKKTSYMPICFATSSAKFSSFFSIPSPTSKRTTLLITRALFTDLRYAATVCFPSSAFT